MLENQEQAELEAPCRWCGYNGENYWQKGTHSADCPWHLVGGGDVRELVLRAYRAVGDSDNLMNSVNNLMCYESETPVRYPRVVK